MGQENYYFYMPFKIEAQTDGLNNTNNEKSMY